MAYLPHGRHLIAGERLDAPEHFTSAPAYGAAHRFAAGSAELVDQACLAAEAAFWSYGQTTPAARAAFLGAIADQIEARAEALTEIGAQETGLPPARLQGERGRTTGQLRLFAAHLLQGGWQDLRHDPALPQRTPLPRPDLKMVQRPIGPVAVFGASNFPLAFSTAGGDTAAALAAGCPVVARGHFAHPGTAEIVSDAIAEAVQACGMHPGVFSNIQGGDRAVGAALVQHPLIRAVGFTGSLAGGRALFDLCAARPEPIPFFGELGSINPMFLLPAALAARGGAIAAGWAASLCMGAGQFCTNPGVVIALEGPDTEAFVDQARSALAQVAPQTMLTDAIAEAYRTGRDRVAATAGVRQLLGPPCAGRMATPGLFTVSGRDWLAEPDLAAEVFGPLGIVVRAADVAELIRIAQGLHGQLTCALHLDAPDSDLARRLMPILERKAGRLLANGFPTGVEVCDAMVHGGPYPASTNFGATSVGTLAIRRFLRPVCYQDMPEALLPATL